MKKEKVTEVGRHEFVQKHRLIGLRRFASTHLAAREELFSDAAQRADVSSAYWSRLMSAERITDTDLKTVARGLGITVNELVEACNAAA